MSAGTKAELQFFDSRGTKIGTDCKAEFMEILNDMEVILFSPKRGRLPTMTFSKILASVSFRHPLHGLLKFEGVLTCKEETRDGTKFYIKIDDSFQEIQKREYFRPDCFLKAAYRLVKEKDSAEELPFQTAETRNISFKGVCILSGETNSVSEKDAIDLVVWLPDNLSIKMRCRVIRITKCGINEKDRCELGCSIEEINERDRTLLTKYITESAVIRKS